MPSHSRASMAAGRTAWRRCLLSAVVTTILPRVTSCHVTLSLLRTGLGLPATLQPADGVDTGAPYAFHLNAAIPTIERHFFAYRLYVSSACAPGNEMAVSRHRAPT